MTATIAESDTTDKVVELSADGLSQRKIAQELGIGKGSVHTILKAHQLAQGKPAGQDAPVMVPFDQILSNPWQPRTFMDPEQLEKLAIDIKGNGLLQNPKGRPTEAGRVQLSFGHRRVAAIQILADRGEWDHHGVPIIVKDLTDVQMVLEALSENDQREDLMPLDRLRFYQNIIETVSGMTITALAESIHLDRSSLSNDLRVLRLPASLLTLVESRDIPVRSAREFLCLINDDHSHEEDIAAVVKRISQSSGFSGAPDWRANHVRDMIRERVIGADQSWRPLAPAGDGERNDFRPNGLREPSFEVQPFMTQFPQCVHNIPAKDSSSRAWTCNAKEWRRLQTAGTRETNKAAEESGEAPPAGAKSKPASKDRTIALLANDPLGRSVLLGGVSRETARSEVAKAILETKGVPDNPQRQAYLRLQHHIARFLEHHDTEASAENLIDSPVDLHRMLNLEDAGLEISEVSEFTRREVKRFNDKVNQLTNRNLPKQLTEEHLRDLGTRGKLLSRKEAEGFRVALVKGRHDGVPEYIDNFDECLNTCNWGAAYVESAYGSPCLSCTNADCYDRKVNAGRENLETKLESDKKIDQDRGLVLIDALASVMNESMAAMIVRATLDDDEELICRRPTEAPNAREYSYYPEYLMDLFENLGIEPKQGYRGNLFFTEDDIAEVALKVGGERLPQLAAALVVYKSNADRGQDNAVATDC